MLLDYLTSKKVQRYCLVMKMHFLYAFFVSTLMAISRIFCTFFTDFFFMEHTVLNSKYQCIDKTTRQREKKILVTL